jgi:LysR family transcriptional regulator, cyn operon transcriptional activator
MNLRFLRTFVGIAEAGSIARAGARLNLSQPAASRQILTLEAELGVRLFDRIGRRYRLTSEGEDLLRHSRHLLMEADLLSARARALNGGHTGILRVGATPMAIETTLSAFLKQHRLRHPGVEVHLVEDGGLRLLSRLEHGDVHLALVVPDDRFRSRPLYPVYNLAILPRKHRLSRRRTLDVADLADEPLLLLQRGFGSRDWFDAACSTANIRPRVLVESTAPHTLIALTVADYGVAVVPSTTAVAIGVNAVPLVQRRTSLGRWLTVAWNPRRLLAAYAEQFVEELAADCSRTYPGREFDRRTPPLPRPRSS